MTLIVLSIQKKQIVFLDKTKKQVSDLGQYLKELQEMVEIHKLEKLSK